MKYNFFINQEAIARAGLIGKTDVSDWMILEYIKSWQDTRSGDRKGTKIWINYGHLIAEMPILGINDKSTISKRLKRLIELGLVEADRDLIENKVYAETTALYSKILFSRDQHPVELNQHPVELNQHPVELNQHPVELNQHPVELNQHPVELNQPIHTSDIHTSRYMHQMQSKAEQPASLAKDETKNQSLITQVLPWYQTSSYEEDINLHFKFFMKRLATFQKLPHDTASMFKRAITDDWAGLRKPKVSCDIPDWAKMPKDDKQLWPWSQKHGYPKSLGQVYETELRKVLKHEVDLRMDLYLDHKCDVYLEQRRPNVMRH